MRRDRRGSLFVERLAASGFRIDGNGQRWSVAPSGASRVVRGAEDAAELELARHAEDAGTGFVLRAKDASGGREIGWTSRLPGTNGEASAASILLEDGRLFRVVAQLDARGARIELRGWEDGGAYWTCRAARGGFRLEPTVAGRCLESNDALLILFAAEVLEAVEE